MPKILERVDKKKAKDLRVLADFVTIFCHYKHSAETKVELPIKDARLSQVLGNKELVLCQDCGRLLSHGIAKLMLCPYDPKPMCKKCKTHCYAQGYREQMRQVMRFSGMELIKRGRIDLIVHYFF